MRILITLLLVGIFTVLACSAPAPTVKLRVLAEEYPPYNYTDEKGTVVGQSTEVVRAIINKLGQNIGIEVMPWEQAYESPALPMSYVARTNKNVYTVAHIDNYLSS